MTLESNQEYLINFCKDMRANTDLVFDEEVECFIDDFKTFLSNQNLPFPISPTQFLPKLIEFTEDPLGVPYYSSNHIGIIKGELKYVAIELTAHGQPGKPKKIMEPIYNKWEKFHK